MWNTPDSIRSISGPERDLIIRMVAEMKNDIDEDILTTGVDIFDRMTKEEQLFALAYVLSSLVDDSEPKPATAAWMDATVYAIFQYLGLRIQQEIQMSAEEESERILEGDPVPARPFMEFRKLLARSLGRKTVRRSHWSSLIEEAADNILWDRDFENEEFFLDLEPEIAAMHKENLGIHEDYFVAPVPHVSPAEAIQAASFIGLMVGECVRQPQ